MIECSTDACTEPLVLESPDAVNGWSTCGCVTPLADAYIDPFVIDDPEVVKKCSTEACAVLDVTLWPRKVEGCSGVAWAVPEVVELPYAVTWTLVTVGMVNSAVPNVDEYPNPLKDTEAPIADVPEPWDTAPVRFWEPVPENVSRPLPEPVWESSVLAPDAEKISWATAVDVKSSSVSVALPEIVTVPLADDVAFC